jgi:hypothetical protein
MKLGLGVISGQSFELAQPEPRTSLARGPESFKICSLWLLASPWLDPIRGGRHCLDAPGMRPNFPLATHAPEGASIGMRLDFITRALQKL